MLPIVSMTNCFYIFLPILNFLNVNFLVFNSRMRKSTCVYFFKDTICFPNPIIELDFLKRQLGAKRYKGVGDIDFRNGNFLVFEGAMFRRNDGGRAVPQ